jgi:hypothetical protein
MKGNRLKDKIAQLSLSDQPNLQSEIFNSKGGEGGSPLHGE